MLWSLLKTWAKEHGYSCSRIKIDGTDNRYDYYWSREDGTTGQSTSVSKLALQIYNLITNNKYIEYQKSYQEKLAQEDIDHNALSGQW